VRIIVEGFGRRVIDMELWGAPLRRPSAPAVPDVPGHDPHSTLASQVEQASEPPPGFGLGFGLGTVVARKPGN
jgi:hypothetical protein